MRTLLYHSMIEDIRSATRDATYHLHIVGDNLCLRRAKADAWREVSPVQSATAMGLWLHGFLEGIHAGHITAKRSA
jgi:hypothetical protein